MCIYVCIYMYMHMYVYICMYVYMYIYIYICVYMCVFVRVYIYTEQNYKRNTLVFAPFYMSWTQRSKTFSMYTKGLFLSNIVHKSV